MKSRSRLTVTQTQRMTLSASLATSIAMLRADAAGLTRYLEEQAAENPHLILSRYDPPPGDWLPRWSGAFGHQGGGDAPVAAAGSSLMAHVLQAIDGLMTTAQDRRIALALAEALEPSGWIGRRLPAIAQDTGCAMTAVEDVLHRLQKIEPTGLFARSLAECLRLQAEDAGILDTVMVCMIDHLDLLAAGQTARLARICAVPEARILQGLRAIRAMDPKPGAQFDQGAAPLREPDLVAVQGAAGWVISVNRSAMPEVHLSCVVHKSAQRTNARTLQRIVAARHATMLRVGSAILLRQVGALERGLAALVPMTLADVAGDVGLHESTVSRVIAGAAVDTPRGTWWLRALFSGNRGEGVSAGALRERLAQLVANEDGTRPMSDAALTVALSQDGAVIARRTIAKYRGMLNIPPAHRRRKGKT